LHSETVKKDKQECLVQTRKPDSNRKYPNSPSTNTTIMNRPRGHSAGQIPFTRQSTRSPYLIGLQRTTDALRVSGVGGLQGWALKSISLLTFILFLSIASRRPVSTGSPNPHQPQIRTGLKVQKNRAAFPPPSELRKEG